MSIAVVIYGMAAALIVGWWLRFISAGKANGSSGGCWCSRSQPEVSAPCCAITSWPTSTNAGTSSATRRPACASPMSYALASGRKKPPN